MYAQVTNNEITRINLQPPFSIPGVSLPRNPDPAFLATMGYFPMVGDAPTYDPATQRLTGPAYEIDGETVKRNYTVEDIPLAELTARLIEQITAATQARLDTFARTRNYDGILSACTYASSTIQKFQTEGQYCVNARDATWASLYTIMGEVEAGTRPRPAGFTDIAPDLPVLTWPAT